MNAQESEKPQESKSNAVKQYLPVLAAMIGIITVAFFVVLSRGAFSTVSDLTEFMAAAKMAATGHGSQIYVIADLSTMEQMLYPSPQRSVVTFFVPPFALPLLLPLALLPPDIAPTIWKGFLLACLTASIFVLQRAFNLSRTATCWLIAALCFSGCTYEALRLDQLSMPMFLAFSCAVWAFKKDRPYLAALALSVLLLKPQQLLPFVVFMLGVKQYRSVVALVGIGAILAIVGFVLVGVDGLHNYSTLMQSTIEDNTYLVSDISCTLRGQLFRLYPHHRTICHWTASIVVAISYLWIFSVGRDLCKIKRWLDYGLVAIMPLGVVTALYCYYYDLLLLIPTLILLMTDFENLLPPAAILSAMILILVFMLPFSIFIHLNWILQGQLLNPHFFVLLLFAMGCIAFYYSDLFKKAMRE